MYMYIYIYEYYLLSTSLCYLPILRTLPHYHKSEFKTQKPIIPKTLLPGTSVLSQANVRCWLWSEYSIFLFWLSHKSDRFSFTAIISYKTSYVDVDSC